MQDDDLPPETEGTETEWAYKQMMRLDEMESLEEELQEGVLSSDEATTRLAEQGLSSAAQLRAHIARLHEELDAAE